MKITHPFAGINKRLTPSDAVRAYVEAHKDLPTTRYPARVKTSWQSQNLTVVEGKPGMVPEGDYTDPSTKEAKDAVLGLYKALKGAPISRSAIAVALNFQMSDEVDKVRDALKEEGVTDIESGSRGKSVRWVGAGATWVPEAKAKKVAGDKPAAEKAPAKAAAKAADKPAPAAGTRPAKRAAKAAAAAAKIAEPHAETAPAAGAESANAG